MLNLGFSSSISAFSPLSTKLAFLHHQQPVIAMRERETERLTERTHRGSGLPADVIWLPGTQGVCSGLRCVWVSSVTVPLLFDKPSACYAQTCPVHRQRLSKQLLSRRTAVRCALSQLETRQRASSSELQLCQQLQIYKTLGQQEQAAL